ncbi:MAG: DUF1641 domain-containing protein [Acidobacteriota bacterium]
MAKPLPFQPPTADPQMELQRKLAEAPHRHAEAIIVFCELLGEAHKQGLLDALHGAIAAKDTIATEAAKYAAEAVNINTLRHILAVGKMVGSLDPAPISRLARETSDALQQQKKQTEPPSIWQLFKRMFHADTRRGLAFVTSMLAALGRATR